MPKIFKRKKGLDRLMAGGWSKKKYHPHTKFTPAHSTPLHKPSTGHQHQLQFLTRSVLAKTKLDWFYLCRGSEKEQPAALAVENELLDHYSNHNLNSRQFG